MKTKSLNKKLVLNKKTVANLDKKEMSTAKGGSYTAYEFCEGTIVMCTRPYFCVYSRVCP